MKLASRNFHFDTAENEPFNFALFSGPNCGRCKNAAGIATRLFRRSRLPHSTVGIPFQIYRCQFTKSSGVQVGCKCIALHHTSTSGSFSAVSRPPIAKVGSFFSSFRDLQDLRSFAPVETQNCRKIRMKFC